MAISRISVKGLPADKALSVAALAKQAPAGLSVPNLSSSQVQAVTAQLGKLNSASGAYNAISATGGLGKYGISANQLEQIGQLRPGSLAAITGGKLTGVTPSVSNLTGGLANLPGVPKLPASLGNVMGSLKSPQDLKNMLKTSDPQALVNGLAGSVPGLGAVSNALSGISAVTGAIPGFPGGLPSVADVKNLAGSVKNLKSMSSLSGVSGGLGGATGLAGTNAAAAANPACFAGGFCSVAGAGGFLSNPALQEMGVAKLMNNSLGKLAAGGLDLTSLNPSATAGILAVATAAGPAAALDLVKQAGGLSGSLSDKLTQIAAGAVPNSVASAVTTVGAAGNVSGVREKIQAGISGTQGKIAGVTSKIKSSVSAVTSKVAEAKQAAQGIVSAVKQGSAGNFSGATVGQIYQAGAAAAKMADQVSNLRRA